MHHGARRTRAEVAGLRQDGTSKDILWPVVSYTDDKGQKREAMANSGSSRISVLPGMKLDVLVKPDQPDRYTSPRCWIAVLIGFAFLVPGILLIQNGLKNFPLNPT